MPSMADITVKKADGTTNVTYVAAVPSAGDKSPAKWTLNALSGIQGFRPSLQFQTQDNGPGSMRQARFRYSYPLTFTDSTTGLSKLLKSVDAEVVVYLPKELTTDDWNEAYSQFGNLLASTLIRDSVKNGFAPT